VFCELVSVSCPVSLFLVVISWARNLPNAPCLLDSFPWCHYSAATPHFVYRVLKGSNLQRSQGRVLWPLETYSWLLVSRKK
jgi:hypothetical protein